MLIFLRKKYFVVILIFYLLGAIYAIIYGRLEAHKMKILPKKVAYWPHLKVGNPVLYIRELKYADEYITYTNKFINEVHATFNFPLKTIPGGDTIYILGYQKDSNLVEFFSPDYHNKIYGFSTGYLHKSLVHDSLRKE